MAAGSVAVAAVPSCSGPGNANSLRGNESAPGVGLDLRLGDRKTFARVVGTYKHVNEVDEAGEKRPITLEVNAPSIVRSAKVQRWEARLPVESISSLSISKGILGGDKVTVTTRSGTIVWAVRHGKGAELVDDIESLRSKT